MVLPVLVRLAAILAYLLHCSIYALKADSEFLIFSTCMRYCGAYCSQPLLFANVLTWDATTAPQYCYDNVRQRMNHLNVWLGADVCMQTQLWTAGRSTEHRFVYRTGGGGGGAKTTTSITSSKNSATKNQVQTESGGSGGGSGGGGGPAGSCGEFAICISGSSETFGPTVAQREWPKQGSAVTITSSGSYASSLFLQPPIVSETTLSLVPSLQRI